MDNTIGTAQFVKESPVLRSKAVANKGQKAESTGLKKPGIQSQPLDQSKPKEVDRGSLEDAVKEANKKAISFNRHLNFSIDDSTNVVVVKVIDSDTGDVVRQIPPEEQLKLMQNFEKMQSLLLSKNI